MATGVKLFYFPFAVSGDKATTPDPSQGSGAVSYQNGWTANYELPLNTNPDAFAINRQQMNGLFNDITTAIFDIQQHGVPSWIGPSNMTPPDYSGNYPYPINALAYYTDGNIYQSVIANNTDTPGTTANWVNISAASGNVPIGTVIDYAGIVPPSNHLITDGSAVSRATYAALFNALTLTYTGTTNSTTTITGLSTTANLQVGYYISGVGIQAGSRIASLTSSTVTMTLAATNSATESLVFSQWALGDGSTTFNIPNCQRNVTMGSGGSVPGFSNGPANVPGTYGGAETIQLQTANMAPHTHQVGISQADATGGSQLQGGSGWVQQGLNVTTDSGTGSAQAFGIVQPTVVMFRAIKYQ